MAFCARAVTTSIPLAITANRTSPFTRLLPGTIPLATRYFASILGPTFRTGCFLHAAQTDRLTNSTNFSSLRRFGTGSPALSERELFLFKCAVRCLVGREISRHFASVRGISPGRRQRTLPAVSFVDPRYTILDDGTGNADHPTRTSAKETCSCIRLSRPWPRDQSGQTPCSS